LYSSGGVVETLGIQKKFKVEIDTAAVSLSIVIPELTVVEFLRPITLAAEIVP